MECIAHERTPKKVYSWTAFRRVLVLLLFASFVCSVIAVSTAQQSGGIVVISVDGAINPATDDYLRS